MNPFKTLNEKLHTQIDKNDKSDTFMCVVSQLFVEVRFVGFLSHNVMSWSLPTLVSRIYKKWIFQIYNNLVRNFFLFQKQHFSSWRWDWATHRCIISPYHVAVSGTVLCNRIDMPNSLVFSLLVQIIFVDKILSGFIQMKIFNNNSENTIHCIKAKFFFS